MTSPPVDSARGKKARLRTNAIHLALAVLSVAAAAIATELLEDHALPPVSRLAIVAFTIACFTGWLLHSVRMVCHADEMQRRIQLEALAFSFFGLAIVALGFEYVYKAGFFAGAEIWGELWQAWRWWVVMLSLYATGYLMA